jgi:hypothetical protein
MRDSWIIGFLFVLAVASLAALAWAHPDPVLTGRNDFIQFYTGAWLVGTPGLYDAARVREFQEQVLGSTADAWRWTRLPYYAALLWPLGRLPFHIAYLVWQALAIAALAGFVLRWKPTSRSTTLLYTSLSLPVAVTLLNGQDLTFLLLALALCVGWRRQGRPFAAGLVLALCAAKFHLLVLTPLLLVTPRHWRWGAGAATGCAALLGLSFAVAGPAWLAAYYQVLIDPKIHPGIVQMPNLHGLLERWAWPAPIEWGLAAAVAAVVAFIAWRASFEYGLAAALAGGLLVSYHSYLADCTLLLPAALIVLSETEFSLLRMAALLVLTPPASLLLLFNSPRAGAVLPLTILALVGLMGWETWRRKNWAGALRPPSPPKPLSNFALLGLH